MTATTSAQTTDSDNSTITVSIAEKVAIDISPTQLNYDGVNPGGFQSTADVDGSNEQYTSVEIENIGSNNITHVWMNASSPSTVPFGSGISSTYDAGNFIQIRSEGQADTPTDDEHLFVNRKEFNESSELSYIFTEPSEDWRYGRFRVGEQEVFWAANTTATGSACTTTGGDFRVGNVAHNRTNTGSNDFRDGSGEYTSYDLQSEEVHEVATQVWVNTSETDKIYDVVVNCDTSETWTARTKYNVEPFGNDLTTIAEASRASSYLINSAAGNLAALQPGEHFELNTAIRVPLGVAQGELSSGVLRVLVDNT